MLNDTLRSLLKDHDGFVVQKRENVPTLFPSAF